MRSALLVPCYNAVRFLPRLRQQVYALHVPFDEVILADDASSDGTADLARSLGFSIITLPENLGPGGARNALAKATSAEWIHFHDVDDEIAPDYLARVGSVGLDDCDAVLHFVDFIDEATRGLIVRWQFTQDALATDPAGTLLQGPMPTMSSFVRRSTFLALGGFNEQYRCFEDGDFHLRLAASGARIAGLPEVLEHSLRHSSGAGSDLRYCFACRIKFLEMYARFLPPRLYPVLATEAEQAAAAALRHRDNDSADRAIALAVRLGHAVPSTQNPLLRGLMPFLPAKLLLRWQDRWRHSRPADLD